MKLKDLRDLTKDLLDDYEIKLNTDLAAMTGSNKIDFYPLRDVDTVTSDQSKTVLIFGTLID